MNEPLTVPTIDELDFIFGVKYGDPPDPGSDPELRRRFNYFSPDDHYEAVVNRLVVSTTRWLDVGCGRDLFPSNRKLAQMLADRCEHLAGVDPDRTIEENPFIHSKHLGTLESFDAAPGSFDLVTLRMVAEHVEKPVDFMSAIHRLLRKDGVVVIYTVNRFSPVPLLTALTPMSIRHPLKKFLWGTEEKDTFPTCFRMNTRKRLRELAGELGFEETLFDYLDDCRTLARFRILLTGELFLRNACRSIGFHYPENCLLGVYRKL